MMLPAAAINLCEAKLNLSTKLKINRASGYDTFGDAREIRIK